MKEDKKESGRDDRMIRMREEGGSCQGAKKRGKKAPPVLVDQSKKEGTTNDTNHTKDDGSSFRNTSAK